MGRHAALAHRRKTAGKLLIIGSLGVASATAAHAVTLNRQPTAPGSAASGASGASQSCPAQTVPVTVAVTPEVEPVVATHLAAATRSQPCLAYTVRSASSLATAAAIRKGEAPSLWIPDSFTWLDMLGDAKAAGWTQGRSLAHSPVVVVTGTRGRAGTEAPPASWSELINVRGEPRMANPDNDTASRLAFFTSRLDQKDKITRDTAARLIFTSRFAKPQVTALFEMAKADPTNVHPFPASEQALFAFDKTQPGLLKAVLPRAGTMSLDYPLIVNPSLPATVKPAVDAAYAALTSSAAAADFEALGFRHPSNVGGPTIAGAPAPTFTELPVVDEPARLAAIDQWDVLRTDMRMLAIVDVSGSMKYPAKGTKGLTRAKVTEESLKVALRVLPGGSRIGGWAFSTHLGGKGVDWKEYAAVRPLQEPYQGKTWREHLIDVVGIIPKTLGGDTGLYDTTWAAYQKMQKEFDPEFVNSVVILTDGENDDPQGGLSLDQLLAKIKASPQDRPVRIVTIGMGEADPRALQAISKATGGTSWIANTPNDIQRVFVEALLARKSNPS